MPWTRDACAALPDKYLKKLRIVPAWDVRLAFVEDASWRRTGDIRIDCDDRALSFGRCKGRPSLDELYGGLRNLE